MAVIEDFNFDDNFVNQLWLEVIVYEKQSDDRNGELGSETLNGDGGNVELALAESIVAEKKWRVMVMCCQRLLMVGIRQNRSQLPTFTTAPTVAKWSNNRKFGVEMGHKNMEALANCKGESPCS